MNKKPYWRSLVISVFVVLVSTWNYTHLAGIENVNTIHVVTLLTCGAGIGVFIMSIAGLIRKNQEVKK